MCFEKKKEAISIISFNIRVNIFVVVTKENICVEIAEENKITKCSSCNRSK